MCGMLVSAGVIWPGCVRGGGTMDLVRPTGVGGTSVRGYAPFDLFICLWKKHTSQCSLYRANGMGAWLWLGRLLSTRSWMHSTLQLMSRLLRLTSLQWISSTKAYGFCCRNLSRYLGFLWAQERTLEQACAFCAILCDPSYPIQVNVTVTCLHTFCNHMTNGPCDDWWPLCRPCLKQKIKPKFSTAFLWELTDIVKRSWNTPKRT